MPDRVSKMPPSLEMRKAWPWLLAMTETSFGCDVVHVELQRVCLLEVGDLLCDALQFLRVGGAFGDLLLEGLLPAFQHALLHVSGLDRSGVALVVFDLVVVDRLQHEMQDR